MSGKVKYGSSFYGRSNYSWCVVVEFLAMLQNSFCCIGDDEYFSSKLMELLRYADEKSGSFSCDDLEDEFVIRIGRNYVNNKNSCEELV